MIGFVSVLAMAPDCWTSSGGIASPSDPKAKQLLTAPTPALIREADASHMPTIAESRVIAVFWSTLVVADSTQTVPSLWITTDLLQEVSALAQEYPTFFAPQPGGAYVPLGEPLRLSPIVLRPLGESTSSCLGSCLSSPSWSDVKGSLGDVLGVLTPFAKNLSTFTTIAKLVTDAVNNGQTIGEAINAVATADATTVCQAIAKGVEGTIAVAGVVSDAPAIAAIGAIWSAGKLGLALATAINDYGACVAECGGVDAGTEAASDGSSDAWNDSESSDDGGEDGGGDSGSSEGGPDSGHIYCERTVNPGACGEICECGTAVSGFGAVVANCSVGATVDASEPAGAFDCCIKWPEPVNAGEGPTTCICMNAAFRGCSSFDSLSCAQVAAMGAIGGTGGAPVSECPGGG